ncbi:yjeF N-terminal domain-containing protein 3-like [Cynoglossus semilaevis]|uniref:YjeF N-terminal domain containing 3 n=1 Tax=Cynoglossus semilaevis TaxID=244447 RepID=A0A3P8WYH7_CYNSE|nr:yjeF N-terminal domain-containing protein 3-like [Cynoglossus semilaevis]
MNLFDLRDPQIEVLKKAKEHSRHINDFQASVDLTMFISASKDNAAKEYEPIIYHPKRSSQSVHQDFTVQCEKMDIPFLSYLPTEMQLINDAYNLVIDAMLGAESDPTNVKEPYCGILCTLKQVKIPIASVDVPSGWDVEEPSQDGIHPEVLISLTAPKKCSMSFSGKHFLAGRFLPYDIQKKYELNLPDDTDCLIEL